jgi:two-component system response regulator RegX3
MKPYAAVPATDALPVRSVLVVEDEEQMRTMLEDNLQFDGYRVTSVSSGEDALGELERSAYALVLLDVRLPGISGYDVCKRLRSRGTRVPVIMLTARNQEADRVTGLDVGADDYVSKPFSVRELLARIKALAKRAGLDASADHAQLIGGHVRLDRRSRQVFLDGVEVHLTNKEFDVLAFLCEDPGAARRRSEIIEHVWGGQWFGPTKTLDAHVAAVRRKLDGGIVITAIRGVGFRVDAVG